MKPGHGELFEWDEQQEERIGKGRRRRVSGRERSGVPCPLYDAIVAEGRVQNKKTRGRIAKKEEKALLNCIEEYKVNYLLFLYDFNVHFSNNMLEKDLMICKNHKKMVGGFRADSGRRCIATLIGY